MSVRAAGPRGSSASDSKAAATAAQELRERLWVPRGSGTCAVAQVHVELRGGASRSSGAAEAPGGVGWAPALLVVVRALRACTP